MKNEHWLRMEEVSEGVDGILLESLNPLNKNPGLYEIVAELPWKSMKKSKVRAYFAREAYELFGVVLGGKRGKSRREKWGILGAAVEMETCSMYYANQAYDGKGEKSSREKIKKNIMAAKITRDLAQEVLSDLKKIDPRVNLEEIVRLLNQADLICESGQYLDVFQNVYSVSGELGFERQIALCEERIHKINAAYFEKIAEMAAELALNKDKEAVEAVRKFGYHYGMLLQIVNDVADFVPGELVKGTREKLPEDAFADVRKGKLTFPVIYTLHCGSEREKKQLVEVIEKGEEAKEEELVRLTKMLIDNDAIEFAIRKGKEYRNKAKKCLKIFPKEERKYLSIMGIMAQSNRYYQALKQMVKEQGG